MGTGVWRRKSPSGVQGLGAGGGLGANRQKPDIYKQFAAVKCFSTQVFAESVLHLPLYPPKKANRICANPMTQHCRGRAHPCPPVATHPGTQLTVLVKASRNSKVPASQNLRLEALPKIISGLLIWLDLSLSNYSGPWSTSMGDGRTFSRGGHTYSPPLPYPFPSSPSLTPPLPFGALSLDPARGLVDGVSSPSGSGRQT